MDDTGNIILNKQSERVITETQAQWLRSLIHIVASDGRATIMEPPAWGVRVLEKTRI